MSEPDLTDYLENYNDSVQTNLIAISKEFGQSIIETFNGWSMDEIRNAAKQHIRCCCQQLIDMRIIELQYDIAVSAAEDLTSILIRVLFKFSEETNFSGLDIAVAYEGVTIRPLILPPSNNKAVLKRKAQPAPTGNFFG
jgi:hypothetical protein